MSGGYFDYQHHRIHDVIDGIDRAIARERIDGCNEWGDKIRRGYSKETLAEFRKGIKALKKAYTYAQRIDYLLSDDDGEPQFHTRLLEELK